MKSWKTTVGGIGTILAGLGAAINLWLNGNIAGAITTALAAIAAGVGLISARDNNVPSSAVPKAAAADAKIKSDAAMITKTMLLLLIPLTLCGCNSVRIDDPNGGPAFRATMVAWPWQDSLRVVEKMNLSSRTNGNFTASIRGLSESEMVSTNLSLLLNGLVETAIRAGIGAIKP